MRGRALRRRIALLAAGWLLAVSTAGAEVVELIPTERSAWGATNLFAPITGFFLGGPGYWYSARRIEVDTTPPGAALDLFYVRGNFQKGYEQADAPATIVLPSRIEAGPRDSLTIRALLDGYRQKEVHVRVRSRDTKVHIDLDPLPNALVAMTHGYFAGRTTLSFVTKESLSFRLQQASDGFTVVLTATGKAPGARGHPGGRAQLDPEEREGAAARRGPGGARLADGRGACAQGRDALATGLRPGPRPAHLRPRPGRARGRSDARAARPSGALGHPTRSGVGLRPGVRRGAARAARSVGARPRAGAQRRLRGSLPASRHEAPRRAVSRRRADAQPTARASARRSRSSSPPPPARPAR